MGAMTLASKRSRPGNLAISLSMIIDRRTWVRVRSTIRLMLAGPRAWLWAANGRIRDSYAVKPASGPRAVASSPARTYAPTSARLVTLARRRGRGVRRIADQGHAARRPAVQVDLAQRVEVEVRRAGHPLE